MGTWGTESYCNDSTWDKLLADDVYKMTQAEADASVAAAMKDIDKMTVEEQSYRLGVVIWVSEQELQVAPEYLLKAREIAEALLNNEEHISSFMDEDMRRYALFNEIRLLNRAIGNHPDIDYPPSERVRQEFVDIELVSQDGKKNVRLRAYQSEDFRNWLAVNEDDNQREKPEFYPNRKSLMATLKTRIGSYILDGYCRLPAI